MSAAPGPPAMEESITNVTKDNMNALRQLHKDVDTAGFVRALTRYFRGEDDGRVPKMLVQFSTFLNENFSSDLQPFKVGMIRDVEDGSYLDDVVFQKGVLRFCAEYEHGGTMLLMNALVTIRKAGQPQQPPQQDASAARQQPPQQDASDPFPMDTNLRQQALQTDAVLNEKYIGHRLIGVDAAANRMMKIIEDYVDKGDGIQGTSNRVPPLMIPSTARSGKTTLLYKLFTKLQEDSKYEPVLISFNGSSGFTHHGDDKDDIDGFCRAVAQQLNDYRGTTPVTARQCMTYLAKSSKKVILLVDELNVLTHGEPPSPELARFLRVFLDNAKRYLVVTCHFPMDIGGLIGGGASGRPVEMVTVPTSFSHKKLQEIFMGEFTQVHPRDVVLYGGLCGLVYQAKTADKYLDESFDQHVMILDPHLHPRKPNVFKAFLQHIVLGTPAVEMQPYLRFTFRIQEQTIWPVCFLKQFFRTHSSTSIPDLYYLVDDAAREVQSSVSDNGLQWEYCVRVATAIVLVYGSIFGSLTDAQAKVVGPCPKKGARVRFVGLPEDVTTHAQAKTYVEAQKNHEDGDVILALPAYADFPILDAIIYRVEVSEKRRLWRGKRAERINLECRGLQMKQGKEVPVTEAPFESILVRGMPPKAARTNRWKKWTYITSRELHDFMPKSLRPLIPEYYDPSGPTMANLSLEDNV